MSLFRGGLLVVLIIGLTCSEFTQARSTRHNPSRSSSKYQSTEEDYRRGTKDDREDSYKTHLGTREKSTSRSGSRHSKHDKELHEIISDHNRKRHGKKGMHQVGRGAISGFFDSIKSTVGGFLSSNPVTSLLSSIVSGGTSFLSGLYGKAADLGNAAVTKTQGFLGLLSDNDFNVDAAAVKDNAADLYSGAASALTGLLSSYYSK